ncbi:hypothetical protein YASMINEVIRUS_415 [Yasminevirus sp. GU-2018]|uniref:Uncharacterized protein n=1 Tax=Yasminevirus sp. GU-2018 TaxID=2420051 RepID=A0A5K0U965_9VIRU|nr:hypothetical protein YASMINEVIRUS_415 [Yasminevirus sp. GU-2018]
MNNKNKENNKKATLKDVYPVSVNSQQCVGPCYYSNTKIIHPLTLEEIKDVDHNFCPVNTFVFTDPHTKKNILSVIDKCFVPTARETKMDDLLRDNVIAPQFHFSSDYFVKVYYKINNLEDLLRWLDTHSTDPYKTRERVFNNGMAVYGDQVTIIDHRMVYFVNDIMVQNLPKIYRRLKAYITVKDDKVILVDTDSGKHYGQDADSEENVKRTIGAVRTYIREKFLGSDNIQQFLSKFVRYYKEEMTNQNISDILVDHMIDYTIKRIKLTLEQQ